MKLMKTTKILGHILFWLSIISVLPAFMVCCEVGEVDFFDILGAVRYSWVMWLFIPIGVCSILIAVVLKSKNLGYKKNIISGCISIALLFLFGSYFLLFAHVVTYDEKPIMAAEEKAQVSLPDNIKIASHANDDGKFLITYAKLLDESEKASFEAEISNNEKWSGTLDNRFRGEAPDIISYEAYTFDYFVFYNATLGEYNTFPKAAGSYECVLIAYDKEVGRILIIDEFTLTTTK